MITNDKMTVPSRQGYGVAPPSPEANPVKNPNMKLRCWVWWTNPLEQQTQELLT